MLKELLTFVDQCDRESFLICRRRVEACTENGVIDLRKLRAMSPRYVITPLNEQGSPVITPNEPSERRSK